MSGLQKQCLGLINADIDPAILLNNIIDSDLMDKTILDLENTNMIDANAITHIGMFFIDIPLSKYPAKMLHGWLSTENEIFPGIVLACLLDRVESLFFEYPMNNKVRTSNTNSISATVLKSHFDKYFAKWKGPTHIQTYLNMWADFANKVKTIKPAKKALADWCRANWIDYDTFSSMCNSIVSCFDKLEEKLSKQITIGKFSSSKLIDLANPLFNSVYTPEFCQNVNEDIYVDRSVENLTIDEKTHYNLHTVHPYKVFALSRTVDKILLYHPVDDIGLPG